MSSSSSTGRSKSRGMPGRKKSFMSTISSTNVYLSLDIEYKKHAYLNLKKKSEDFVARVIPYLLRNSALIIQVWFKMIIFAAGGTIAFLEMSRTRINLSTAKFSSTDPMKIWGSTSISGREKKSPIWIQKNKI